MYGYRDNEADKQRPASRLCAGALFPGPGTLGRSWGLGPGQWLGDDPYHGLASLGALHVQH